LIFGVGRNPDPAAKDDRDARARMQLSLMSRRLTVRGRTDCPGGRRILAGNDRRHRAVSLIGSARFQRHRRL